MYVRQMLLSVVGVVALLTSVAPADAQVTLRYKFKKGETNKYEMVQDMKMSQNVMGKSIDTQMKQTLELSQTVDDVLPDGSAKISSKVSRVKMAITGPVEVTVDSAAPDANDDNPVGKMMAGVIKTLAKLEFTANMKETGEMSDFKIPDAVLKEFRNLPGSAQMGDMFSEEGIKNMMSQSGLVLPKDAVKTGDSWNQKTSTKLPFGKMNVDIKCTYLGQADGKSGDSLAKISYTPTSTLEPDRKAPLDIKITSQKGTGTILFDNTAGRMQEMTMDQVIDMSVSVLGQTIDQTINQRVTMKLTK